MSVKKYLDLDGLSHFKSKLENEFVVKEVGKGLSTNDYTTEEKNKLAGIESGAEVNIIESISVNSTPQSVSNKNVDITVPTDTNDLTNGAGYQTASQVESAIDSRIGSTYKAKGTVTFANLPALTSTNEGNVYNVSDAFTTTADFVEGAGNSYPAGTNVVIIDTGSGVYKYDVLSGFVDLSDYVQESDLVALTNSEIDTIFSDSPIVSL